MSRRNRSSRRRTYGKRQHEVQERRPTESAGAASPRLEDGWITSGQNDDSVRRVAAYDAYDVEGWSP
jgi:hypothetical protein